MLKIDEIRIENCTGGCVTDRAAPEIAFSLSSDEAGASLEESTIQIGAWQKSCGACQTGIVCDSLPLEPFTEYLVEVTALDNHGNTATGTGSFQTGRMGLAWEARWITDNSYRFGKKVSPTPMTFCRRFKPGGKIKKAWITATAIGIYELELNGGKVGNEYFAPGFTSYKKTLQYQYYDVTEQIAENNTLTAVVAGGWAVGRFTYESRNRITTDRQSLLLELFLEYDDGRQERIVTDSSWEVTVDGHFLRADFYDGETFDATVDLSAARWKKADEIKLPFSPEITAQYGCKVVRQEKLKPKRWFRSGGELIYDFGQNFAGIVSLEIDGEAGQKITVRHAEALQGDELFVESLRTAKATAVYICKQGRQSYAPAFTYMGFRYIGVSGIDRENLCVSAYALHSDFEEIGSFLCSNEQLNQLQSNIRWSGKSNFVDIPTDCPQRDERQGWTGDIAIFASTACYNFELSRFFEKWLNDVRLEQGRGGGIPMVVPRHGSSPPVVATACWGDCCILVPWAEYLARGNRELLERMYPTMKRFLKAVRWWARLSGPGKDLRHIWKWLFQFGDWCAPEGSLPQWMAKGKWVATAYYAGSCAVMSQFAGILGYHEDCAYYARLHEDISRAYLNIFTDRSGKLEHEFQTGYVLPLYFNMVHGQEKRDMAANLNRLIEQNDYHLNTGFTGTPYLLFALADNGYVETAYRVLLQESCPSWLYEVKMGGTTFWEQWDAITPGGEVREPSLNHYAYGAVGDFLYRRIVGIEPLAGGYRHFRVKPVIGGGLTRAKGSIKTPYGIAAAAWELNDNAFTITVDVPVSASCELILPGGEKHLLQSGSHKFTESLV